MIESNVRYTKNGLRLSDMSEIAPIIGADIATINVEMLNDMLYKISGACFSNVSHRTKYKDTIFIEKN